jgi:hypothetical protein
MFISKLANIDGKLKRIELSDKEYEDVMERLIKSNVKELKRCIKYAPEIRKDAFESNKSDISTEAIIRILAEKQLVASYTATINEIDFKISRLKNKKGMIEETFERYAENQSQI